MNVPLYPYQQKNKPNGGGWLWLLLVLAALVVLVFSGCCKKVYPVAATTVHDTVTITRQVRYRDTNIIVPGAGVTTNIGFTGTREAACASVVRDLRKRQAHLKVTQNATGLTIDCNCDTMSIKAQLRDSLIEASHKTATVKTIVQRVKYVPFVVKILAWFGGICFLGLLAYLSKKFWLK